MDAVVLLSGGIDSTTVLAQALEDGMDHVTAVTFRYGSLHEEAESGAAADVASWYDSVALMKEHRSLQHLVVHMPAIFAGGQSALMGNIEMPGREYQDLETEGPSPTVVPFRNANLLAAATTIAESTGAGRVYAGMHASDHNKWAYPDCSPEFLGAYANAIYVGTMHKVRLVFPFVWMTKAEVVLRGHQFMVPFDLTWSCYVGKYPEHCGECPTCLERANAFRIAGVMDPTVYKMDSTAWNIQWQYDASED